MILSHLDFDRQERHGEADHFKNLFSWRYCPLGGEFLFSSLLTDQLLTRHCPKTTTFREVVTPTHFSSSRATAVLLTHLLPLSASNPGIRAPQKIHHTPTTQPIQPVSSSDH
jgi:hypothetical protein